MTSSQKSRETVTFPRLLSPAEESFPQDGEGSPSAWCLRHTSPDSAWEEEGADTSNNSRRSRTILPTLRRPTDRMRKAPPKFTCTKHTKPHCEDRYADPEEHSLISFNTGDFLSKKMMTELTADPYNLRELKEGAWDMQTLPTPAQEKHTRAIYRAVIKEVQRMARGQIIAKWQEACRKIRIIWRVCRVVAIRSFEVEADTMKMATLGDKRRDETIEAKKYYTNFLEHIKQQPEKELQITAAVRMILTTPAEKRTPDEVDLAMHALQTVAGFCIFSLHIQRKIAHYGYFVHMGEKRVIVRQGHHAENWYFVISGQAMAAETDEWGMTKVSHTVLKQGSTFGEFDLMKDLPRKCTVTSRRPMQLVALNKEHFREVFRLESMLGDKMIPYHVRFLKNLDFMKFWPWENLLHHTSMCFQRYTRRKQVLVKDSSKSEYIYIVRSGTCKVYQFVDTTRATWRDLDLWLAHPTVNLHHWPESKVDVGPGKLKRRASGYTLYNRLSSTQFVEANIALLKQLALGPPYEGVLPVGKPSSKSPDVSTTFRKSAIRTSFGDSEQMEMPPWFDERQPRRSERRSSIRQSVARESRRSSVARRTTLPAIGDENSRLTAARAMLEAMQQASQARTEQVADEEDDTVGALPQDMPAIYRTRKAREGSSRSRIARRVRGRSRSRSRSRSRKNSEGGDLSRQASEGDDLSRTDSEGGGLSRTASKGGGLSRTASKGGGLSRTASKGGGLSRTASKVGGLSRTASKSRGLSRTASKHRGQPRKTSQHSGQSRKNSEHIDQSRKNSEHSDQSRRTSEHSDQSRKNSEASGFQDVSNSALESRLSVKSLDNIREVSETEVHAGRSTPKRMSARKDTPRANMVKRSAESCEEGQRQALISKKSCLGRRQDYQVPDDCKPPVPPRETRSDPYSVYTAPSFVLIDTLCKGDVFGLDQLNDPRFARIKTHKVAMISEGAEIILLNKNFFVSFMSERCVAQIIDTMRAYPDPKSIQTRIRLTTAWQLWSDKVVDEYRRDLKNKGRTLTQLYFQEPVPLDPNSYLKRGAKYPEDPAAALGPRRSGELHY